MKDLDKQLKTLQRHLNNLKMQARKARGRTQKQLSRLERQTRVTVARAVRRAEPVVRRAVSEATRLGYGVRAGVRAGVEAYRASGRPKR